MAEVRDAIRDILGICSRKPHSQDPKAGPFAVELLREIEALASMARDLLDGPPPTGFARDGIEAQYGLNDIWPGDPYPPRPAATDTEGGAP